jgi:hypothetical protein
MSDTDLGFGDVRRHNWISCEDEFSSVKDGTVLSGFVQEPSLLTRREGSSKTETQRACQRAGRGARSRGG